MESVDLVDLYCNIEKKMGSNISTALALPLGVGIPILLVTVAYIYFFFHRRRLLEAEDSRQKDLEAVLRDDALLALFNEESKGDRADPTPEKQRQAVTVAENLDEAKEILSLTAAPSLESQSSTGEPVTPRIYTEKFFAAVTDSRALSTRSSPRTNISGYDFFDTIIPVMDPETANTFIPPPAICADRQSVQSNANRSACRQSVDTATLNKSLDALAALLHNPQFTQSLLLSNYTPPLLSRSQRDSYPSLAELEKAKRLSFSLDGEEMESDSKREVTDERKEEKS